MTSRSRPLRIAITADPELPVPPLHYGGIERVIDMLVHGLEGAGHEVTLFAHPGSRTGGRLVPYPGASSASRRDTLRNMLSLNREIALGRFDLVHSFGRIAYLLPLLPLPLPKLMTYQREVTPRSVSWGHRLSRGTLHFSAISRSMMQGVDHLGNWHLVYNGVPLNTYRFVEKVAPDAPLVFLGRIEHIKGPHLAIRIARATGRRLVIAGNVPDAHSQYFRDQVEPFIDGSQVTYIGPVDDAQKNELLGAAAALLMPILWEEPFGIVMAEALACGTPVLGMARGSVPEVVSDGVTGFVRSSVEGLASAVSRIPEISRAECRRRAETLFSDTAVTASYIEIYKRMCRFEAKDAPA